MAGKMNNFRPEFSSKMHIFQPEFTKVLSQKTTTAGHPTNNNNFLPGVVPFYFATGGPLLD